MSEITKRIQVRMSVKISDTIWYQSPGAGATLDEMCEHKFEGNGSFFFFLAKPDRPNASL